MVFGGTHHGFGIITEDHIQVGNTYLVANATSGTSYSVDTALSSFEPGSRGSLTTHRYMIGVAANHANSVAPNTSTTFANTLFGNSQIYEYVYSSTLGVGYFMNNTLENPTNAYANVKFSSSAGGCAISMTDVFFGSNNVTLHVVSDSTPLILRDIPKGTGIFLGASYGGNGTPALTQVNLQVKKYGQTSNTTKSFVVDAYSSPYDTATRQHVYFSHYVTDSDCETVTVNHTLDANATSTLFNVVTMYPQHYRNPLVVKDWLSYDGSSINTVRNHAQPAPLPTFPVSANDYSVYVLFSAVTTTSVVNAVISSTYTTLVANSGVSSSAGIYSVDSSLVTNTSSFTVTLTNITNGSVARLLLVRNGTRVLSSNSAVGINPSCTVKVNPNSLVLAVSSARGNTVNMYMNVASNSAPPSYVHTDSTGLVKMQAASFAQVFTGSSTTVNVYCSGGLTTNTVSMAVLVLER